MVILGILLKRLVKLLKSESAPSQIAMGFAFGMSIGLMSLKTLFAVPILLVIILVKVNLASVLFSSLLFRLVAYLLGPAINYIGYLVLVKLSFLRTLWINLYSTPLFPYTRFNNTMIMGGLILDVILFIPIYLGMRLLIVNYKLKYEEKIKKWKIIKVISASRLVKWVTGFRNIGV